MFVFKRYTFLIVMMMIAPGLFSQSSSQKYLIVRADDMGSFHSANQACIQVVKNGIARSIEVMVPCAWFPEAATLVRNNPGIDVGIHLVLTSEWGVIKWRPLTEAPTLVDSAGYFYPFIWPWEGAEEDIFLISKHWSIAEIERELRAQIETGLKFLPGVTHLSAHMGFTSMDLSVLELVMSLGEEYGLLITESVSIKKLSGWDWNLPKRKRIRQFVQNIKSIEKGYWLFVEHPGIDGEEMRGVGEHVARDRQFVTDILTNEKVKRTIRKEGITLIGYNALNAKVK